MLPNAQILWSQPDELIAQWEEDESKTKQEILISEIVGSAGSVVDLGCGVGRYYQCLNFTKYQGYDQSSEMVARAIARNKKEVFSCVDITRFQVNERFDTGICIDVAYHQENPIEFIKTIFRIWDCKRLFFTLLVGNKFEQLYNSTVISKDDFDNLVSEFSLEIKHQIDWQDFSWVLLQK